MSVTLEQKESSRAICLEGAINIAFAAEFKRLLIEALEGGQPLSIRLDQATGLDVCIVQLLVATVREWKQSGVGLALLGPLKNELSTEMMGAGFERLPVTLPGAPQVHLDVGVTSEV
jgi:anti-anti-sigma regulatory factor